VTYYLDVELSEAAVNYHLCYSIIIFFGIINIFHYILFVQLENKYKQNYENILLTEKYKYREEHYKTLEKYQTEIKSIKHDLTNQTIGIRAHIINDDKIALKEINSIINDLQNVKNKIYTENVAVNAILNSKYSMIDSKKNIKCLFRVKLPKVINISEKDLLIILGNIIDNAIESCDKIIDNKFIELDIIYYVKSITISLTNAADAESKNLISRKVDKANHGLGMKTVKALVEKYNGSFSYRFEGNTFITSINLWDVEI